MKTGSFASQKKLSGRAGLRAAVALALFGFAGGAFADPPVTMAPPVGGAYSQAGDLSYDNGGAGQDSVFQWQEVPADQRVPIRRAVFDRGGYQLFDSQGETIIIPFTDNNLYVMKFARSTDGTTYFVNGGDAPILYVPRNGYLENAAVPGARWFPFSEDFNPAEPVFLGIAPSWDDYIGMGWYPDMVCYGGYWGYHPYVAGSLFFPSFGLSFVIGGHRYNGWEPYHRYYNYHPAPYHITIFNRNVYRYDGRTYREHDFFRGTGHPYEVHRDFNNDHRFTDNRGFGGQRNSGDRHDFGAGRGVNDGRVFRGTGNPTYAHRDYPGSRDVPGGRNTMPSGGQDSGRGHTSGGDQTNNRPVFSGGFGHSSDMGSRPNFPSGGDRGSGRSGGNGHVFGGGNSRPASGGSDGGRTFGGGTSRPASGGQEMPSNRGAGSERPSIQRGNDNPSGNTRPTFTGGFGHVSGGERPSGGDRPVVSQRSFGGGGGDRSGGSRPAERSSDRSSDKGNDHSSDKSNDHGGGRH